MGGTKGNVLPNAAQGTRSAGHWLVLLFCCSVERVGYFLTS